LPNFLAYGMAGMSFVFVAGVSGSFDAAFGGIGAPSDCGGAHLALRQCRGGVGRAHVLLAQRGEYYLMTDVPNAGKQAENPGPCSLLLYRLETK
jgi:hypothetical protein